MGPGGGTPWWTFPPFHCRRRLRVDARPNVPQVLALNSIIVIIDGLTS